jgi:hypothetical protein
MGLILLVATPPPLVARAPIQYRSYYPSDLHQYRPTSLRTLVISRLLSSFNKETLLTSQSDTSIHSSTHPHPDQYKASPQTLVRCTTNRWEGGTTTGQALFRSTAILTSSTLFYHNLISTPNSTCCYYHHHRRKFSRVDARLLVQSPHKTFPNCSPRKSSPKERLARICIHTAFFYCSETPTGKRR